MTKTIFQVNKLPGFDHIRDGYRLDIEKQAIYSEEKGRNLKPQLNNTSGYFRVGLMGKDGKQLKVYIHDLVAAAVHGRKLEGTEVDHIDHDRTNNHPDNLQYVTLVENRRKRRPQEKAPEIVEHAVKARLHAKDPKGWRKGKMSNGGIAESQERSPGQVSVIEKKDLDPRHPLLNEESTYGVLVDLNTGKTTAYNDDDTETVYGPSGDIISGSTEPDDDE